MLFEFELSQDLDDQLTNLVTQATSNVYPNTSVTLLNESYSDTSFTLSVTEDRYKQDSPLIPRISNGNVTVSLGSPRRNSKLSLKSLIKESVVEHSMVTESGQAKLVVPSSVLSRHPRCTRSTPSFLSTSIDDRLLSNQPHNTVDTSFNKTDAFQGDKILHSGMNQSDPGIAGKVQSEETDEANDLTNNSSLSSASLNESRIVVSLDETSEPSKDFDMLEKRMITRSLKKQFVGPSLDVLTAAKSKMSIPKKPSNESRPIYEDPRYKENKYKNRINKDIKNTSCRAVLRQSFKTNKALLTSSGKKSMQKNKATGHQYSVWDKMRDKLRRRRYETTVKRVSLTSSNGISLHDNLRLQRLESSVERVSMTASNGTPSQRYDLRRRGPEVIRNRSLSYCNLAQQKSSAVGIHDSVLNQKPEVSVKYASPTASNGISLQQNSANGIGGSVSDCDDNEEIEMVSIECQTSPIITNSVSIDTAESLISTSPLSPVSFSVACQTDEICTVSRETNTNEAESRQVENLQVQIRDPVCWMHMRRDVGSRYPCSSNASNALQMKTPGPSSVANQLSQDAEDPSVLQKGHLKRVLKECFQDETPSGMSGCQHVNMRKDLLTYLTQNKVCCQRGQSDITRSICHDSFQSPTTQEFEKLRQQFGPMLVGCFTDETQPDSADCVIVSPTDENSSRFLGVLDQSPFINCSGVLTTQHFQLNSETTMPKSNNKKEDSVVLIENGSRSNNKDKSDLEDMDDQIESFQPNCTSTQLSQQNEEEEGVEDRNTTRLRLVGSSPHPEGDDCIVITDDENVGLESGRCNLELLYNSQQSLKNYYNQSQSGICDSQTSDNSMSPLTKYVTVDSQPEPLEVIDSDDDTATVQNDGADSNGRDTTGHYNTRSMARKTSQNVSQSQLRKHPNTSKKIAQSESKKHPNTSQNVSQSDLRQHPDSKYTEVFKFTRNQIKEMDGSQFYNSFGLPYLKLRYKDSHNY